MRFVVVDASVGVKWFSREDGTDLALALLDDATVQFLAPDIFRLEVINGVLKQYRFGHLPDTLLDRAFEELAATMPELVPSGPLVGRALVIARRLRHPIYDCLYLALAERRETVFITADVKFVKLCRAELEGDPIVGRIRLLEEAMTP